MIKQFPLIHFFFVITFVENTEAMNAVRHPFYFQLLVLLVSALINKSMCQNVDAPYIDTRTNYTFSEIEFDKQNEQQKSQAAVELSKSQVSAFKDIRFLGPYNCAGRTRALLIDRVDSNLMFAGGTSGGLFRSNDKALTWFPLDDQSTGLNVNCITQSPFDANIIYYGTGETKNTKIKSKGTGVYKSTDNGLTFFNLSATNSPDFYQINSIKHSLTDPNTIYLGTTKDGVYRSTDAGNTFQKIYATSKMVYDIECFPDGKVLFTLCYKGIYISQTGDSGTFVKASQGLPAGNFSRIEASYCDSFPDVVYAVFADSVVSYTSGLVGVYKSSDAGVTWNAVTNPTQPAFYPFADFLLSIQVRPQDSNFVFCGGDKSLYTRDGGLTWTKLPYSKVDHHIYIFDPFKPNYVYAGNDQGVSRYQITPTQVYITNWIDGYNIAQIWAGAFFPSGDNCLLGVQDNFFLSNTNSDSLFQSYKQYGIDGCFVQVNQQDSNIAFISGNDAQIFRCDSLLNSAAPVFNLMLNELDADSNQICDDEPWHVNPIEMNLLDGTQLYFATENHIYRTTNSGNNWTAISNSYDTLTKKPMVTALTNHLYPTLYAAGTGGFFCRIDSAYNATPGQEVDLSFSSPAWLTTQGKVNCIKAHPTNDGVVYAAIIVDNDTVSHIWKITGADSSNPVWTDISGNLSKTFNVNWIEVDPLRPDSVLFAATDYGLYATTDAGVTWNRETAIPLITIYNMRMRASDRKLFVFTFGRGVWLAQLDPGNPLAVDELNGENLIHVYPNPATEKISVDVSDLHAEIDFISVSNAEGAIVYKSENGFINASAFEIDLQKCTPGIYILNVVTGSKSFRKKIVKL